MNDTLDGVQATKADVVLAPLYGLVVLLGIACNSLIITVVKTKRCMQSTTNCLLANLAVADLLTLVWCVPAIIMSFVPHPHGKVGDYFCKFVTMQHIPGVSMIVSGLTLSLVAVERYKALVKPLDTRLLLNTHNVRYAIGFSWGFAVVFVTPLFVLEEYDEELEYCVIHWPGRVGFIYWTLLALIVSLALVTMTFCYFSIIRGMYFSNTICSSANQSISAKEDARFKKRIVQMLLTVTGLFLVCFLPFVLGSAAMMSHISIFNKVATFLVYCNCTFNPFVYAFASSSYRQAFKEVLHNLKLL